MKQIGCCLAVLAASSGLLSCAAEKMDTSRVHPAVELALWTTAQMPAVDADLWQAFAEREARVDQVLMQLRSRSGEFIPMGDAYTDPDHLGGYIEEFLGSVIGGSSSGGGGGGLSSSLPSAPSVGGTLPSYPSVGGSLPTAPSVGSMTLSPTPAFMQNFGGGGAAGSGTAFVGAFCRFLGTALSWTTRCSSESEGDELFAGVNQACRQVFTREAEVYLGGIPIPPSVINGLNCISDAMNADTSCEGQYLENAFQSCGLIFEN
jgi:hypothetical protein